MSIKFNAKKFEEVRQEVGLTLQSIAEQTGHSFNHIWMIKEGKITQPKLQHIEQIAKVLRIAAKELLDFKEEEKTKTKS